MWDQGGQPWQQWPLNQQQWMQSFQHQQDPSQIDWAALAQAWIAQREASGQQSMVEQPPGMMPNGQDMSTMESGPNNHGNFQGDSNFNRMWQPEWGMHQQPPHPPDQPWMPPTPGPMDIVPPSEDSNSQDSGEFAPDNRHIFNQNNHNFGGPPDNFAVGPVNQFDYQHGAAFGPPQGGISSSLLATRTSRTSSTSPESKRKAIIIQGSAAFTYCTSCEAGASTN